MSPVNQRMHPLVAKKPADAVRCRYAFLPFGGARTTSQLHAGDGGTQLLRPAIHLAPSEPLAPQYICTSRNIKRLKCTRMHLQKNILAQIKHQRLLALDLQ